MVELTGCMQRKVERGPRRRSVASGDVGIAPVHEVIANDRASDVALVKLWASSSRLLAQQLDVDVGVGSVSQSTREGFLVRVDHFCLGLCALPLAHPQRDGERGIIGIEEGIN